MDHGIKCMVKALVDTFKPAKVSEFLPNTSDDDFDFPSTYLRSHTRSSSSTSLSTANSSSSLSSNNGDLSNLDGNVCDIHGYLATSLVDMKGKHQHACLPVLLGLRSPKGMKLSCDSDETQLQPGNALTSILGIISTARAFQRQLKKLHKKGQINHCPFSYDWRLSLLGSSAALVAHLEKVYAETGEGSTVIAHSMAGLITVHAIKTSKNPLIFKRVILAGSPLKDACGILASFKRGDNNFLSRKAGAVDEVYSRRTPWFFLPKDSNTFVDMDGTSLEVDLMNAASWATHNLVNLPKIDVGYVERCLESVTQFRAEMEHSDPSKSHLYPPIGLVTSVALRTPVQIKVKSLAHIKTHKFRHLQFGPGDGTVSFESMNALPADLRQHLTGSVRTSAGHIGLLTPKAIGTLLQGMRESEGR